LSTWSIWAPSCRRCTRLIRLYADVEGLPEAHYSDLLAGFDNPLDHLGLFLYFDNYILMSELEHGLLARHVLGPPLPRVAFVGSGLLPLSSLVLAARHLPAACFNNYDICGEANERVRAWHSAPRTRRT
jgi:nicotianamine synthase